MRLTACGLYFIGVALCFTPAVQADTPQFQKTWAEFILKDFTYKEFADDGELLDREDGILPGVGLGISWRWPDWYINGLATIYYNQIRYDGQTQMGVPLETSTDELIIDSELSLAYLFPRGEGGEHRVYIGIGSRYWERDIKPGTDKNGNPVSGLFEIYEWPIGFLGGRWQWGGDSKLDRSLDVRLFWPVGPNMSVDLLADDPKLDLGANMGVRVGFPMDFRYRNKTYRIEPFVEQYEFDRSPVVLGVFEPRSKTRNLGVKFKFDWD